MKKKFKSEDIFSEIQKMHDALKQKQESGELENDMEFLYVSDEFKDVCIKNKDKIKELLK